MIYTFSKLLKRIKKSEYSLVITLISIAPSIDSGLRPAFRHQNSTKEQYLVRRNMLAKLNFFFIPQSVKTKNNFALTVIINKRENVNSHKPPWWSREYVFFLSLLMLPPMLSGNSSDLRERYQGHLWVLVCKDSSLSPCLVLSLKASLKQNFLGYSSSHFLIGFLSWTSLQRAEGMIVHVSSLDVMKDWEVAEWKRRQCSFTTKRIDSFDEFDWRTICGLAIHFNHFSMNVCKNIVPTSCRK